MNRTTPVGRNVLWSSVTVAFLFMLLFQPTPAGSQSLDFGELQQERAVQSLTRNLAESKKTLWTGNVDQLMFETTIARNTLIWVGASGSQLHLSTGRRINLYPGEIQHQIPGRILSLDVNRMPHLRNRVLIAVSYWSQNRLVTELFSYNIQTDELISYYTENMSAIRPLNDFLYGQSYDPGRGWATDIFRMKTVSEGYAWNREIKVPAGARLLHMERLPGGHVSYIKDDGSFVISRGERIKRAINENFGANARYFGHYSPREDTQRETVRIPPQYIPESQLIAVPKNGVGGGSVSDDLGTNEQGAIELFRWRNSSIVNRFTIGPIDGRILDVEISDVNPSQLLWLRKTSDSGVALEMIDFSQQNLQ